jgi:integrase
LSLPISDEISFAQLLESRLGHYHCGWCERWVVQERLGHASAAFTMQVYGHVAAGLQQEAANSFEELMSAEM